MASHSNNVPCQYVTHELIHLLCGELLYDYMERAEDGTVWYFGFVPRVTRTQNAPRQPKCKQPVVRRSHIFTVLETIQKLILYASTVQAFAPYSSRTQVESRNSYFRFESFGRSPGLWLEEMQSSHSLLMVIFRYTTVGEETETKKSDKKALTLWPSLTWNVAIARSFRFIIDRHTLATHCFVSSLQQQTIRVPFRTSIRLTSVAVLAT